VVGDATGAPTGLLKEGAVSLVAKHVPPPTPEDTQRALRKGMALLASYGLTSIQDAGFSEGNVAAFERLLQEGGFKVRVRAALPLLPNPDAALLERYRALRTRHAKDDRLRFEAVKAMLDGVIDAKTASMLEPYTSGGLGLPNWADADLERAVATYDRDGFQVMLHACGDRAIRQALDAFEKVGKAGAPRERRHRVEHAEIPTDVDRARFETLGVVASTQALFANPDKTTLENYAVLLGPARTSRANAFKRFDAVGAAQAFGSDWPVFSAEVLKGIYCAVTRVTPEGTPQGGFYPENRISVEAALRHFTAGSAYAAFEERKKGTLTPGKLADFVVLSDDILAGPPEQILKARVVLTVMGGEETYRAPR
jgi:predicted amidohydrolase YtcJ